MITIRLKSTVFDPGGIFEGTLRSRAVLILKAGRDDVFAGKVNDADGSSLMWRGGQTVLQIDANGTQITDMMLELYMKNEIYMTAYGAQLLHNVERGVIEVVQDFGAPMTVAALKAFTA